MFSQHFVADILEAMGFSKRYPGADVAVFLRVRIDSDDGGDFEDQGLFDLWTYPTVTAQPRVSCPEKSRPWLWRTEGRKVPCRWCRLWRTWPLLMCHRSTRGSRASQAFMSLVAECIVSLLVALLVYGRQVLVLSYKNGMERATMIFSFKSRLVADMSHENRMPLNGIIGTAELLAEERLSVNAGELVNMV